MPEIEFLDVDLQRNERQDPARGRERFSFPGHPLDEPDFEVASEQSEHGESNFRQDNSAKNSGEQRLDSRNTLIHEECYACPIGVAYGAVRGVRPETTDRLANAIADLVEAAAGAIDMLSGDVRRTRERVRRVDIE